MSSQQFTFPPPPPPPPAASQTYHAYNQARGGQNGYGGRGNRGDKGNRGYGRGIKGGGSRGGGHYGSAHSNAGYGGYPGRGSWPPLPPDTGYNTQMSNQGRGGYPLPDYPLVQLPQYPANLGQEYGHSTSKYPETAPRPIQEPYPTNVQHAPQQHGGQQQHGSYGYGSPAQFSQPAPNIYQNPAALPPRPSPSYCQPILMGPPIRWAFGQQEEGNQTQQYPQPSAPNGANPYQKGPPSDSGSPYYHSHSSSTGSHSTRHDSPNSFPGHRGRGQKRGHGDAFGRPRNQNPRPQVAPAVPSFVGPLPLPMKPPVPQERPAKRGKKKRKHNQLGLTPKTEEHESSEEEEDDIDEEARLAAVVASPGQGSQLLQFEYKGHISTLQSSSDIAAWIEERRKKFPTKARAAEMAERGRQRENAQEAANQARKEAQEKQQAEAKERRKKKEGAEGKRKKSKDDPADVAARAKRKVEKLRKQLEKEERRAAKAEAKASNKKLDVDAEEIADQAAHQMDGGKKRKRSASDASESTMIGDTRNAEPTQSDTMITANETTSILPTKMGLNETPILETAILNFQGKPRESVSMVSDPLTPMSQPPISDDQADPSPTTLDLNHAVLETGAVDDQNHEKAISLAASNTKLPQDSSSPTSESSSDISSTDSEDLTSSSGSPSSDANSDEDAPDHFSSKRNGPEKVAPPKRTQKISICHEFLKNGRCRKGDRCKWRHELPERGSRGADKKDIIKPEERKERVGLYQRLVEQEKEKEDHAILNAIISLGEKGLLEPEEPTNRLER